MKWRVIAELTGSDGAVRKHVVSAGGSNTAECSPGTVGLTLADGKRTLARLQDHLVQAQTAEYRRQRQRRRCFASNTRGRAREATRLSRIAHELGRHGERWPEKFGRCVKLHETGGKQHAMPCHHALAEALRAYIDAAGIAGDRKDYLFRTARGHRGAEMSEAPMGPPNVACGRRIAQRPQFPASDLLRRAGLRDLKARPVGPDEASEIMEMLNTPW